MKTISLLFCKLLRIFTSLEKIALAYFPVFISGAMVIQFLNRKFEFGFQGLYWLEELSRYMLILITFLGASVAVTKGELVSMDALYSKVPDKIGHILKIIVNMMCAAFLIYFCYYAWSLILSLVKINIQTSTLGIPMYIPYLPILLFSITMFIRFIIQAIKEAKFVYNQNENNSKE